MKKTVKIFSLPLFLALTQCSYVPKSVHDQTVQRLTLLEEKNEKQLGLIEELFNRQEALLKSMAVRSRPAPKASRPELPDEVSLYSQVIAAFRSKDLELLLRATKMMKKNYPKSVYLDNAYFLNARALFERENWAEAKEWVYRLEGEFPLSSKLPAAKLLNARIEKRLGDKRGALGLLEGLQNEFPGSPEAHQAGLEHAQLKGEG